MKVKIAQLQHSCSKDTEENHKKVLEFIEEAGSRGANIVCTQELYKTQYFCQVEDWNNFKYAEVIDENNQTIKDLSKLAKKYQLVIIASLFERRAKGVYHNTAVVIDTDGKLIGKYRKMHIPDDPHFYEKFYFTEGDLGYQVFKTRYGNIGVLICWDQWFPEAARLTALKGADMIFYPTAIGWLLEEKEEFGKSQYNAWETVQRGHSVANGCFVITTNRVGFENSPDGNSGIEFWGQSFITNTYGEILNKASVNREEILLTEVDLREIEETRKVWPFFRDRRVCSYNDLTKKWLD